MTTVIVIAIVAVCVVVGLVLYSRGGKDGGPAPYRTTEQADRERLDRKLERNQSFERAEQEFQEGRRPTHDEP